MVQNQYIVLPGTGQPMISFSLLNTASCFQAHGPFSTCVAARSARLTSL